MTLPDLFLAQIMDPFRIALLIGLVLTMGRTRAITGTVVPLLAGVVFVAVIIPMTVSQGLAAGFAPQVGLGLVTNLLILAVVLGAKVMIDRRKAG